MMFICNIILLGGRLFMFMVPYGDDLLDDFRNPFENFFKGIEARPEAKNFMTTDVIENADSFEIIMDIPGVQKDNIKIDLEDGCLTISASNDESSEQKNVKDGSTYIRKERHSGQYKRRFFVGKNLTTDDIKAKFENGTLKIDFPKDETKKLENNTTVSIEG